MKSNMKKSLFLAAMFSSHICLAQSWDLLISTPEDELPACAIENSFGNYLVCGCIGSDITWEYDGYVAEISPTGAVLNEKRFSNPLNMLCFIDIMEVSGGYLVFGHGWEDSTFAPSVFGPVVKKLDYDLNEQWSKSYKTDSCSGMVRNTKRMDDGTFAGIGVCTATGPTEEILFYRFDQNGDTLDAKLLNSGAPNEWGWDVLGNGGSGYKIFTKNYPDTVTVGTTWNVANLDSNLNLVSFKSLSEGTFTATLASFFKDPFSAKWLNDSVYMVAGRVRWNPDTIPPGNPEFEIGLVFYSQGDSVLSAHRFGKVDSNDVPAHYQAVDFVYRDAIYVGGTSVNLPGSSLSLFKLDSTGALLWEKYYGQDYLSLLHVLATQDSGCLLVSYIDNGNDEHDIYLLKVGPDGEYVPGVPTLELPKETFTIYPNPASDYFTIRSNFNLPAFIELYNITGSLVHKEPVTSNRQQVSVQGLSSGLYVWRLVSKGREARGKVVVE